MDYKTVVSEAMIRAGVREDSPSTLVNATGITRDFALWVADTYRNIQTAGHKERWFFRQSRDETLTLTAGQDEYEWAVVAPTLWGPHWQTLTVYETSKTDETDVLFVDYYDFRMEYDTKTVQDSRPKWATMSPDGYLMLYPAPDKAYTLRFDGILAVDSLLPTTDAGVDGDQFIIPEDYQYVLVWGAVKRYAKHHEDGTKLADAKEEYRAIYDSMVGRQLPDTKVVTGHLYGARRQYGR